MLHRVGLTWTSANPEPSLFDNDDLSLVNINKPNRQTFGQAQQSKPIWIVMIWNSIVHNLLLHSLSVLDIYGRYLFDSFYHICWFFPIFLVRGIFRGLVFANRLLKPGGSRPCVDLVTWMRWSQFYNLCRILYLPHDTQVQSYLVSLFLPILIDSHKLLFETSSKLNVYYCCWPCPRMQNRQSVWFATCGRHHRFRDLFSDGSLCLCLKWLCKPKTPKKWVANFRKKGSFPNKSRGQNSTRKWHFSSASVASNSPTSHHSDMMSFNQSKWAETCNLSKERGETNSQYMGIS